MLVGQITGYSKGYLGVRTSAGKNVSVHVVKTTLAHRGPETDKRSLHQGRNPGEHLHPGQGRLLQGELHLRPRKRRR